MLSPEATGLSLRGEWQPRARSDSDARPNPYTCIPVHRREPQEAHALFLSHSFSFLNFIYVYTNTWHSAVVEAGGRLLELLLFLHLWAQGSHQQASVPSALHSTILLAPGHTFFVVLFCLKQLHISQADLKFVL